MSTSDKPEPLISAEAIDRGLVAPDVIPPCAKSARLELLSTELGKARSGARADVFRPPRR